MNDNFVKSVVKVQEKLQSENHERIESIQELKMKRLNEISEQNTKSLFQKFITNPWILLISGIVIEEVTLGKIYKYIVSLF